MQQLYISKPAARQRFDQLCQEKNEAMPTITVTRELDINGNQVTQTYERKKKAISDGAQSTGKAIIQSFAYQFKRIVKALPADMLNEDGIPSFKTNNVKMARFRGNVTDRTVRNHIRELKSIGLVTDYKYHGSKANFELWLSPEVIFGTEQMPQILKKDEADSHVKTLTKTPVFENTNDTNFPHRHSDSIVTSIVTKNTTTKKVEKLSSLGSQEYGNKPSTSPSLPLSQPSGDSMVTSSGGGRRAVYVDNTPKVWINDLSQWKTPGINHDYERLPRPFQHYVAHFWQYAQESLWKGKIFLPQEKIAAMNSITAGVYQKVFAQNPGSKNLDKFQKLLFKAIDKAAGYYSKSEKHYPGEPYAKFKQGQGYFDAENPRGFQVAYRWAFKDAAAAHEKYGEKVLADAIRHLKNYSSGKIPKSLKHLSFIELYRHYETKIKQKFSSELLKDYYKQALTLPAFK